MAEVTQADREAAANFCKIVFGDDTVAEDIRSGVATGAWVQAFTRHREAGAAEKNKEIFALKARVAALEAALREVTCT